LEYRNLHNEPKMSFDDRFGGALLSQAEISEKLLGFFAQDEIRPVEPLMINVGVRYDTIWTDFENDLNDALSFENSHRKWRPRAGISYTLFPELNVFGNYSQGIRTVNLSRSPFQLRENIKPEEEESFEVGLRGNLFKTVDYNLAGFYNVTRDKIIQVTRFLYENAGEARAKGIEAGVNVTFPHGLYAGLDYTYLDAEFTDFTVSFPAPATFDNNRVPLVPEHVFGVNAGWRSPRFGHINASVRYVGSKYIDRDYANSREKLPDYWVADLKYTYIHKNLFCMNNNLELTFAVNNVFDEIYAEYGDINGGLYAPFPVAWPADGRAFFGGIAFKF
jgi:outer membrane receptor protein involved in Fe transport